MAKVINEDKNTDTHILMAQHGFTHVPVHLTHDHLLYVHHTTGQSAVFNRKANTLTIHHPDGRSTTSGSTSTGRYGENHLDHIKSVTK